MQQIHKQTFRRINKDASPYAMNGNAYSPGDLKDVLNGRYRSSKDGLIGDMENISGNILKTYSEIPATGTNKTIGQFYYGELNSFIYLIYNSLENHQIVLYRIVEQTFSKLVSGSFLGFTESMFINQGGVIDDILVYNDVVNSIRAINIESALGGFYDGATNEQIINLGKAPFVLAPDLTLISDNDLVSNRITSSTYKFSARIIYKDDMASTVGPFSKSIRSALFHRIENPYNNTVVITYEIDPELVEYIKAIEFIYVKDDSSDYVIYETQRSIETTMQSIFQNKSTEKLLSDEDAIRLFDSIPNRTDALEIIGNRVVALKNIDGLEVPQGGYEFSAVVNTDVLNITSKYFKPGAVHKIGLVFGNDKGRVSFVQNELTIEMPTQDVEIFEDTGAVPPSGGISRKLRGISSVGFPKIDFTITGEPPVGATWYQIVVTKDLEAESWSQFGVIPYYFIDEYTNQPDSDDIFVVDGYRFWKIPHFSTPPGNTEAIFFKMPNNLGYTIEKGHLLKFLNQNWTGPKEVEVLDVISDYLVIGKDSMQDSSGNNIDFNDFHYLIVEAYFRKTDNKDVFHEVGHQYPIIDGEFSITSGSVFGDTYVIDTWQWLAESVATKEHYFNYPIFRLFSYNDLNGGYGGAINSYLAILNARDRFISPTPKLGSKDINIGSGGTPLPPLDYNFIANDYGRPHIINEDEIIKNQRNSLVYSYPHVQDTRINGLASFSASNQYDLPVERGPVRAIVRANDVLLSIHETETSSVYINEGILRQGDLSTLVQGRDFIGDDRVLEYGFGTINPESVLSVYGWVFFWDAIKGCVVRYSKAGLHPISHAGMRNYFYQKSRQYSQYRNSVKIIMGFDYYNDELLITFPNVEVEEEIIIEGETWAFNVKEEIWVARYSFLPECYSSSNNELFCYKDGQLWHQEQNILYNNFFGVQYERIIKFYVNSEIGINKTPLNIHVDSNYIYSGDDEEYKVVIIKSVNDSGQETFIPAYEFEKDENKWYAPVLMDINTLPALLPEGSLALRHGEYLVAGVFEIEVKSDRTDIHRMRNINTIYRHQKNSI